MRSTLLSVLLLLFPALSRADGLIDMSGVNKQVNDVEDSAHRSMQKALVPADQDQPAPKGKGKGKGKGKAKAQAQKSTGLIDMSGVNQQANDVTERAHRSVQGALTDPKAKSSNGKVVAKSKAKAKPGRPPPPPEG